MLPAEDGGHEREGGGLPPEVTMPELRLEALAGARMLRMSQAHSDSGSGRRTKFIVYIQVNVYN